MNDHWDKGMARTSAGPVAVHRAGRGDPVVLLHGNGHSAHEFDRVLPALASRFTLIGWDMPGHGASSQADAGLSIDDRAAVLRSEEHTSELQSLIRTSYAVFRYKKKHTYNTTYIITMF